MSIIDQLIYTWSEKGLDGQAGYGVRAASQGLSDPRSARYQALSGDLQYTLPTQSTSAISSSFRLKETAPICLALLQKSSERILIHKLYTGVDALGREGPYLTHLLAGLPDTFTARQAILLWHAQEHDFWITNKDEVEPTIIPPVSSNRLLELAAKGRGTFSLTDLQDALRQVLEYFLQNNPPKRVYLAGSSEEIAAIIWGVTQSLPLPMQKGLTFNTYEDEVKYSRETLVGLTLEQPIPVSGAGFFYVNLQAPQPVFSQEQRDAYITFALEQLEQRHRLAINTSDQLEDFLQKEQDMVNAEVLYEYFKNYQAEQAALQAARSRKEKESIMPLEETSPNSRLTDQEADNFPGERQKRERERLLQGPFLQKISTLPASTRISLLVNGVLILILLIILISLPFSLNNARQSGISNALATVQSNHSTPTNSIAAGNGKLELEGAYPEKYPVNHGDILMIDVVVKDIDNNSVWSGKQGEQLVCVSANDNPDTDCQAIQNSQPGSNARNVQIIPVDAGIQIAPNSISILKFSLKAQLASGAQPGKIDHHQILLGILEPGQSHPDPNKLFLIHYGVI